MTLKKSDDAVSPVIGVMLMLVITVIIAAVVTGFATGLVKDTEPAPTAVLDARIFSNVQVLADGVHSGLTGPDFWITHVSGDPIDTGDVEIRVSWTDQNGKYHYSTYSAAQFKSEHPEGVDYYREQPMYVKASGLESGKGYMGLDNFFGEVILTPGLKLTATADFLWLGEDNKGSPFMNAIFNNGDWEMNDDESDGYLGIMQYLPKGTAVDVMLLHIPSNKAIFNKVVFVE